MTIITRLRIRASIQYTLGPVLDGLYILILTL